MPKFIETLDYSKYDASMPLAQWLGRPPEYNEAAITEVYEADVVVCGAGLAGVAAARAAVEEGASVLLLEKCSTIQARSTDFGSIGSKYNARYGREMTDKRNEIVNQLMRAGNYFVSQRTLSYWADNSGADLDWYIDALDNVYIADDGLAKAPEGYTNWIEPSRWPEPPQSLIEGEMYPTYQVTLRLCPIHTNFLQANLDRAAAGGLCRTFFEMPAKKLTTDGEGRVTGVIAEGFGGRLIRAVAKKGVVLATGDYAGNHDMLYYYCPWLRQNTEQMVTGVDPAGYHANTGDGHRMAIWLGAQMEDCPHAPISHHMGAIGGIAPFLQLDIHGERFMNEDCGGQEIDNQIKTLPGHMSWQIADSDYPDRLQYMALRHGTMKLASDGSPHPLMEGRLEAGIEQGRILKADALEELIDKAGLPRDAALASIRRYNELARGGEDSDFGKAPSRLFPIEKPPFYAACFKPTILLNCVSGIDCDHNTRCYDAERKAIPGLYVTGNVQGRRFSVGYPVMVPGMSHSMALTFGRLSGKNAARGV